VGARFSIYVCMDNMDNVDNMDNMDNMDNSGILTLLVYRKVVIIRVYS